MLDIAGQHGFTPSQIVSLHGFAGRSRTLVAQRQEWQGGGHCEHKSAATECNACSVSLPCPFMYLAVAFPLDSY